MKKIILSFFVVIVLLSGCFQTKYDEPKFEEIPVGRVITMADVWQIFYDSVAANSQIPYKFKEDISVYLTITMDDKNGNIYKSAYAQDASYGVNLRLLTSGGLYRGDSIRINLKNTLLSMYPRNTGILQIDSINVDNNITKIATQKYVTPVDIEIENIDNNFSCKLVRINNVQFTNGMLDKIFATKNSSGENDTIENCNGNIMICRTSGYANFQDKNIPTGKGSMVCIVSKYNNAFQLIIRSFEEIQMDGLRCGEVPNLILEENFDDGKNAEIININGWLNISNNTTRKWRYHSTMAIIENDKINDTTWLVLPIQNIPANAALQFETQRSNLGAHKLELVYSNNFTGTGNPKTANWTTLNYTEATDANTLTQSGVVDLPTGNIYIAFRYLGPASTNIFWLDNIKIYVK